MPIRTIRRPTTSSAPRPSTGSPGKVRLFRNAFVSVPSCTPSRAALNTGRHFFRNGSHSQLHHPWQKGAPDPFDKIKGMPVTLQDGGYHIGLTYKLHMRDSIIGGKQNIYNKAGGHLNQLLAVPHQGARTRRPPRQAILDEVRGNFRDFLAKRKKGQPFFYSFNPTNTHRKWVRGSGKALWGLDPGRPQGQAAARPARRPADPRGHRRLPRRGDGLRRRLWRAHQGGRENRRTRQHHRRHLRRPRHPRVPARQVQRPRLRLARAARHPLAGTRSPPAAT